MANNYVQADFTATPSDQLVTQDVYGITESAVVNKPSVGSMALSLIDAIANTIQNTSDRLTNIVPQTPAAPELSLNELTGHVSDITGFSPSISKMLVALLQDDKDSVLKALGLSELTTAELRFNETKTKLDRMDYGSAKSIASLLSALTDNQQIATIINQSTEAQLFASILKIGINAGIPQIVDLVLDKVSDEKTKRRVLIESLDSAVAQCDFATIDKIIDLTSLQSVLERMPNIVLLLLNNYRFKRDTKSSEYPALRATLLEFIGKLDATWAKLTRNGGQVNNFEPFLYASRDAVTLLDLRDGTNLSEYHTQVALAKQYRTMDLWALGRSMYGRDLVL